MAKRRKLEAPSSDELSRIEAELNSGVGRRTPAPIAQVAAESANAYDPRSAETRAIDARDRSDAQQLREAQGRGLVMVEIPLDQIDADALVRDRIALDPEEMTELTQSIAANGLRLPIEVFEVGNGPRPYGLLSGYRRLKAMRDLNAQEQGGGFAMIKAVLREPAAMGGTFAAMVEENEIRAALSHFERGRIAVIAAQQGAFPTTEAAVAALFPSASKAKRSKIRSFANIFEELGDLLNFPDALREKDGLRLAGALRDGASDVLRTALADAVVENPAQEIALLDKTLSLLKSPVPKPSRGGRPQKARLGRQVTLPNGVGLQSVYDGEGWMVRLFGESVDDEMAEAALEAIERALSKL